MYVYIYIFIVSDRPCVLVWVWSVCRGGGGNETTLSISWLFGAIAVFSLAIYKIFLDISKTSLDGVYTFLSDCHVYFILGESVILTRTWDTHTYTHSHSHPHSLSFTHTRSHTHSRSLTSTEVHWALGPLAVVWMGELMRDGRSWARHLVVSRDTMSITARLLTLAYVWAPRVR